MTKLLAIGKANTDIIVPVDPSLLERFSFNKGNDNLVSLSELNSLIASFSNAVHHIGGSAANTSINWSILGSDSSFLCALGNDEIGKNYEDAFSRFINCKCIPQYHDEFVSPTCICLIPPDNDVTYVISEEKRANLSPSRIDWSRLKYDILHLEGGLINSPGGDIVLGDSVLEAKSSGTPISITLPPHNIQSGIQEFRDKAYAEEADFIFGNQREFLALYGISTIEELIQISGSIKARQIVTLGSQGALAIDKGQVFRVNAAKTEVVNALGAGDCFAASFLHATTVDGLHIKDALAFATQNTNLVLRSSTAMPNIP